MTCEPSVCSPAMMLIFLPCWVYCSLVNTIQWLVVQGCPGTCFDFSFAYNTIQLELSVIIAIYNLTFFKVRQILADESAVLNRLFEWGDFAHFYFPSCSAVENKLDIHYL